MRPFLFILPVKYRRKLSKEDKKMNKNITELVFIIDKSGSMSGLEKDTIGGFNSLIEKQKKEEGEVVVTAVLFNAGMRYIYDREDLKKIGKMTDKDYVAEGCTALLDAVGNTIEHITGKQKELKDEFVPAKTMVVITTDGLENSSRKFGYPEVKKLVERQKELGWEFIFLGANIDVCEEAAKFGVDKDNAVSYCCDSKGIDLNYEALSCAICEVKKSGTAGKGWRKAIDRDYAKREKGK